MRHSDFVIPSSFVIRYSSFTFAVPFAPAQAQLPHSQTSQVQNSPLQSGHRQSAHPHAERAVAPVEAA